MLEMLASGYPSWDKFIFTNMQTRGGVMKKAWHSIKIGLLKPLNSLLPTCFILANATFMYCSWILQFDWWCLPKNIELHYCWETRTILSYRSCIKPCTSLKAKTILLHTQSYDRIHQINMIYMFNWYNVRKCSTSTSILVTIFSFIFAKFSISC